MLVFNNRWTKNSSRWCAQIPGPADVRRDGYSKGRSERAWIGDRKRKRVRGWLLGVGWRKGWRWRLDDRRDGRGVEESLCGFLLLSEAIQMAAVDWARAQTQQNREEDWGGRQICLWRVQKSRNTSSRAQTHTSQLQLIWPGTQQWRKRWNAGILVFKWKKGDRWGRGYRYGSPTKGLLKTQALFLNKE